MMYSMWNIDGYIRSIYDAGVIGPGEDASRNM